MQYKDKLAIFDLDGTLFDTKDVNFHAYQSALKLFGIELDYDYYCRECNGKKYTQFLNQLCFFNEEIVKAVHKQKKINYSSFLDKAVINSNLFEIINGIKETYHIALVTTASKKNTYEILDYFDKTSIFELIITQDDVQHPKPSPEGFEKAIRYFGVEPTNCIIFEDSSVGLDAARKCTNNIYIVKGYN